MFSIRRNVHWLKRKTSEIFYTVGEYFYFIYFSQYLNFSIFKLDFEKKNDKTLYNERVPEIHTNFFGANLSNQFFFLCPSS